MKQKLLYALDCMKKYNTGIMYRECFGFEPDVEYDVLVIAPGWKPTRIIKDPSYKVTELAQQPGLRQHPVHVMCWIMP